MRTAIIDVQEAIFGALDGKVTLAGETVPVFDNVPDGQDVPYIMFGETSERAWNTKTRRGTEQTVPIHVFASNSGGREDAVSILNQVIGMLDDKRLTVADHALVGIRYAVGADTVVVDDPDGETVHVVARFWVIVQEV